MKTKEHHHQFITIIKNCCTACIISTDLDYLINTDPLYSPSQASISAAPIFVLQRLGRCACVQRASHAVSGWNLKIGVGQLYSTTLLKFNVSAFWRLSRVQWDYAMYASIEFAELLVKCRQLLWLLMEKWSSQVDSLILFHSMKGNGRLMRSLTY